jgi:putative membrane protein
VAFALVLTGLGTAVAGYGRWRANEAAIRTDQPLPASWLAPTVTAALAAVVVVVAVLVGIEVLSR